MKHQNCSNLFCKICQSIKRHRNRFLAIKIRKATNIIIFKNNASNLLGSTNSYVLKRHIESKFKPGMTWNNHGINGWHIDHIRPLIEFDLTNKNEFQKASHYTNLQPLWAYEHILKHAHH